MMEMKEDVDTSITSIIKELEVRLPQIRYALEFNDPEFGLNHLRHLESILTSQPSITKEEK